MVPFWVPILILGLNTGPNLGDPKRDHNFDNPPCEGETQGGVVKLGQEASLDLVKAIQSCPTSTRHKNLAIHTAALMHVPAGVNENLQIGSHLRHFGSNHVTCLELWE